MSQQVLPPVRHRSRLAVRWPVPRWRSRRASPPTRCSNTVRRGQGRSARRHRQEDRRHSSSKTCACRRSTASTRSRAARTSATCSSDGRYVIIGDMIDLDNDANLTENRRRGIRTRMLDSVPEAEMLVFSPKESEVHHHGVHRHRLRLLPAPALADRRVQPARHSRALPVLSRAAGPTPSRGTRPRPCGARPIATTR